MRLRVIGVGGPGGDDAVGWWVAESLRERPLPGGAEVVGRDRPGLGLLDELEGLDAAVLVDAMRGGGPLGCVRILAPEDLPRGHTLSSHDLGVAESLALAEALGRRLPAIRLVGIEVPPLGSAPAAHHARSAVPEACAAVVWALQELCREPRRGGCRAARAVGRSLSSGTGELL